jgi:hypothetical protein
VRWIGVASRSFHPCKIAKLSGSDTLDIKDIQLILAPGGLGARASCCARYSPPAAFLKATTAPEGRGLRRSRMELGQEWKELYPLMAALHKEGRYDEMVLWVEDGEAKQGEPRVSARLPSRAVAPRRRARSPPPPPRLMVLRERRGSSREERSRLWRVSTETSSLEWCG